MAQDVKIAYLKSLQGYLWLRGYENGDLRCPLFADVAPAMSKWVGEGRKIVIYSSGSVAAQKLLFQYTNTEPSGDLRGLISGWFDTINAGMKQESESYEKIAHAVATDVVPGLKAAECLFLSDNAAEVWAAKEAGMMAAVVVRDGNAELSKEDRKYHVVVESFDQVEIV
jgi:enolase-phosphatase E1